jgi:acetyl-CoA C-acetyltransferase
MTNEVYIVDGVRTPFLKMKGGPGPFAAADLGVTAAKTLLARQPFAPESIQQVVVGCAAPSEDEANIARIIALRAGCGNAVPAWTVQRNCASGLQAIDSAAQSIASGQCDLVLAGGCEAMSRTPLLWNQAMVKWLSQLQKQKNWIHKLKVMIQLRPHFFVPVIALIRGLTDPVVNLSMGQTAEELAYRFKISRSHMDQLALQSHQRSIRAQSQGEFDEITPLYGNDGSVVEQDDGVRADTTLEILAKLKPVFDKYGNITAGNSSQISDGAAFVILASESAIKRYHLPILAKIVDTQWAALNPAIMGLGPVHAMTPILQRQKLALNDIEHIEINEAFAAQVLACKEAWAEKEFCQQHLGLSEAMGELNMATLNPHGGAIAIGHPVGASGARLVLHCAKMIKKHHHRYSMASLCIGGGQGGAILLEQASET